MPKSLIETLGPWSFWTYAARMFLLYDLKEDYVIISRICNDSNEFL
ncbi:MAG: hypothetical protein IT281_10885 [Ignavibacteria bacterium]|nr:hypothetical protein [Ignavibacteria bacterium]